MDNYYKTELLRYSKNNFISSFYPLNENQFSLYDSIKDKSIYYYDLPVWFFQKHWIEVNKSNFYINISPFINFSYGKSTDTSDYKPLFRNTRGVYSEGQIGKKVSFQFIVSENQASFSEYESIYFRDRGELYTYSNGYSKQNAIIPSGARTKDFKKNLYPNAYDYAFSIGSIAYQVNKSFRFEFGNNQHFVGIGYRSLLLSDNTIGAPYFRLIKDISKRWSYQFLTKKHLNNVRKPSSYGLEAPYENKWYLAHYLSFKANKSLCFSLFTGGNQLRADSITKHNVNPLFLIPTGNTDLWNSSKLINGINGVNIDLSLNTFKIYSQIVADKYEKQILLAYQLGFYYFDIVRVKFLDLQLEYNYVPNNFYSNKNFKNSYSNGNLPLAHPKGNNFSELFLKLSYSIKRFQFQINQNIYYTKSGIIKNDIIQNSIFYNSEIKNNLFSNSGFVYIFTGELIYRFNNKYNGQLYFQYKTRISDFDKVNSYQINYYLFGLRVSMFNQYFDF